MILQLFFCLKNYKFFSCINEVDRRQMNVVRCVRNLIYVYFAGKRKVIGHTLFKIVRVPEEPSF